MPCIKTYLHQHLSSTVARNGDTDIMLHIYKNGQGSMSTVPVGSSTIYVCNASHQETIMSSLNDLAVELENPANSPLKGCRSNTGDVGEMFTFGVTSATRCPTHKDLHYLKMIRFVVGSPGHLLHDHQLPLHCSSTCSLELHYCLT